MFVSKIDILFIEPCYADPEKIRLKAELDADIGELMPYLNAVIEGAIYNQKVPVITFTKEFRLFTVYRRSLTLAKALNTTNAYAVLDWFLDLVNNVYVQRDTINPYYGMRKRATVLDIYKRLPRLNCRECGELCCFAFAALLTIGEQELSRCKPLAREEFRHLRKAMEEIGYVVVNA